LFETPAMIASHENVVDVEEVQIRVSGEPPV
jgi:hypothetical protein